MTLKIKYAEDVLTPKEAAELKGVSVLTIHKAIERGQLKATKFLGRDVLQAADVDAYEPRKYGKAERVKPRDETIWWQAADKLRGSMDAADYKHTVLGLVFLKYVSDRFEARRQQILAEASDPDSPYFVEAEADRAALLEDRDEYRAENVFWVPAEARWPELAKQARSPDIGTFLNEALDAVEAANPTLKGVLPKDYAKPALDKRRLGELVDLISNIGHDEKADKRQDTLGKAYEYFLGRFASAEGKRGGEFYTPGGVVRLLVEMLAPYAGRIYDPCCGSGGMFVQSEKFVQSHGGRVQNIAIYGQELNATTWKLAKMNLAIRGIDGDLGQHHADTFHHDLHPGLKADFVLANPPFNISDWWGNNLKDDVRWKNYGTPPPGNANYAWIEHIVHHLAPTGRAGFVLANGSMSSNTSGEGDIRAALLNADLVECIVALPGQLFFTTQIPVCLWFLARSKGERRGQTLFLDARQLGVMENRTLRVLPDADIARLAATFHAWQGKGGDYADIPGFCKSAPRAEIASHGDVLTPGRYVGAADVEADAEHFPDKLARLAAALDAQFAQSATLEAAIRDNLRGLQL